MRLSLFLAGCVSAIDLLAGNENCYLPLDVMILQDTTGSFVEDLPNVARALPDIVNTITNAFPSSQFGAAEFRDKPFMPMGETDDFCYKLGDGKLSPNLDDFTWVWSGLMASGGGDLPEASFQALINIAKDAAVGWRPLAAPGVKAEADQAGARIVIMSTDAQPHVPGYLDQIDLSLYPDIPRNWTANSGDPEGNFDFVCRYEEYPTPDQVVSALKEANIYLAMLIPDDAEVLGAWHWFNEVALGQPADFLQIIANDSSNVLDGVLAAVKSVTEYACPLTTPPPTTGPTDASTTASSTEVASSTTEVPSATTEAPSSSTVSDTLTSTTGASTTTKEDVVPSVTTESGCPPCPEGDCPCPSTPCEQAAVVVKLDKRPKLLKINYEA